MQEIKDIKVPDNIQDLFNMTGCLSIVTGGASGLGEAIALGLAAYGSDILLMDMNEEGLARVCNRIQNLGRQCKTFILDVTDWDNVLSVKNRVKESYGAPDVLVNSAGMNIRKPVLELAPVEFKKVVDVDLTGTFMCCKAFGQLMVEKGRGSIINLASINAHVALERNSAYAAAKGGVVQLTRVLALEWAPYNVRVNALSPAHHKTPLVEQLAKDSQWYDSLIAMIPQGRFAEAYEIIGPMLFLASKASAFTTGISLLSDGGWTMV